MLEVTGMSKKYLFESIAINIFHALKVLLCIYIYSKCGLIWSVGVAFFFLLNKLYAIEKGIYDNESKIEELKDEWNPISNLRKPI